MRVFSCDQFMQRRFGFRSIVCSHNSGVSSNMLCRLYRFKRRKSFVFSWFLFFFFFISMVLILNGTGICECFSLLVIRCMLKFVLSIVQIYWQAFFLSAWFLFLMQLRWINQKRTHSQSDPRYPFFPHSTYHLC